MSFKFETFSGIFFKGLKVRFVFVLATEKSLIGSISLIEVKNINQNKPDIQNCDVGNFLST